MHNVNRSIGVNVVQDGATHAATSARLLFAITRFFTCHFLSSFHSFLKHFSIYTSGDGFIAPD